MKKILFVCHGNICRSPMAEFVMRDLLRREGMQADILVASAGTSSEEYGNSIYPPVQRILRSHSIDPSGKFARTLTLEDYEEYDILVAMEHSNLHKMKRLFSGDPQNKCLRLLDVTDRPGDIADPWYSGDFQATWDDVSEGCQALLLKLLNKNKKVTCKSPRLTMVGIFWLYVNELVHRCTTSSFGYQ